MQKFLFFGLVRIVIDSKLQIISNTMYHISYNINVVLEYIYKNIKIFLLQNTPLVYLEEEFLN